ncbi:hypothetical protein [Sphingomonas sp.]|uniref:hypothetical protein n=1 Tax=Sphingomonas sp. TaxID=28214 RepID=UPI003AFF8CC5
MSSAPPPELVAPLPPALQVPAEATDAAIGQYIVDLRDVLRVTAARFEALRAWVVR